eukprot:TRINITY_DN9167_c0_g1_i1.p1 TRINITY_DN9167_c0_g1~~TRINITY_DN9167_c0_g1_i1.p1  ORF type:complete len:515 (+),score=80.63 TRINITY_DN9167_c0_g1_i1:151-1695(+)
MVTDVTRFSFRVDEGGKTMGTVVLPVRGRLDNIKYTVGDVLTMLRERLVKKGYTGTGRVESLLLENGDVLDPEMNDEDAIDLFWCGQQTHKVVATLEKSATQPAFLPKIYKPKNIPCHHADNEIKRRWRELTTPPTKPKCLNQGHQGPRYTAGRSSPAAAFELENLAPLEISSPPLSADELHWCTYLIDELIFNETRDRSLSTQDEARDWEAIVKRLSFYSEEVVQVSDSERFERDAAARMDEDRQTEALEREAILALSLQSLTNLSAVSFLKESELAQRNKIASEHLCSLSKLNRAFNNVLKNTQLSVISLSLLSEETSARHGIEREYWRETTPSREGLTLIRCKARLRRQAMDGVVEEQNGFRKKVEAAEKDMRTGISDTYQEDVLRWRLNIEAAQIAEVSCFLLREEESRGAHEALEFKKRQMYFTAFTQGMTRVARITPRQACGVQQAASSPFVSLPAPSPPSSPPPEVTVRAVSFRSPICSEYTASDQGEASESDSCSSAVPFACEPLD